MGDHPSGATDSPGRVMAFEVPGVGVAPSALLIAGIAKPEPFVDVFSPPTSLSGGAKPQQCIRCQAEVRHFARVR